LTVGLLEKLADCNDFSEAIVVFETKIKSLELKLKAIDRKITDAVKIIEESKGEIKIFELAEQINLSVRQLQRRFRKSSGLSPKQYVRARRIRATAVNLVIENKLNWATRAAEMGFTDQAHLNHEFLTLTGRTPNSFAEKVKHIEHGEFKI
jgi:transcriptional regulator GlxA family with amidase domain